MPKIAEKPDPNSEGRIRVGGHLPREVYAKYKQVLELERKKAKDALKPEPSESSIVAMLVARGIISYFADLEV